MLMQEGWKDPVLRQLVRNAESKCSRSRSHVQDEEQSEAGPSRNRAKTIRT